MKTLTNYNLFLFEKSIEMIEIFNDTDILESIITDSEALLKTINAKKIDLFQSFNFNPDDIESNFSIDLLYNNKSFNKCIIDKKLKKNELESTEETETFIKDTIIIKFFSIYKNTASELEQPKYIIYQNKKKSSTNWEQVKCYKVNNNMKNFYNKLTNKSIEINKSGKTYLYITSNSGNDWQLQSQEEENNFKNYMSNDDIKAILIDNDVSITILA
jgi:hypothetical protein